MNRLIHTGLRVAAAAIAGFTTLTALADDDDLTFRAELHTYYNAPTLRITNASPLLEIPRVYLTIGRHDRHFDGTADGALTLVEPPGGTAYQQWPRNSR